MKKLTNSLRALAFSAFGLAATLFNPLAVRAQCPLLSFQYPSTAVATPTTMGDVVQVSSCSFGGDYTLSSGYQTQYVYTINLDNAPSGYITMYDAVTNTAVAYGAAPLAFTPPANGDYKIQWSVSAPSSCGTDGNCHVTTITLSAPAPPPAPPAPTQDPTPPTCTAGSSLSASGTPPANVTWYWQSSATGTSMANPASAPLAIAANGTYYVRAYDASLLLWSTNSSSYTVTNFPTATAPPAPTADINPSCAPTGSVLSEAAAPPGYVYYWQGTTLNGSSTAQDASSTYSATTSGTYYVAAYETATQCWSNTTGITISVDSYIPPPPVATEDPVNACLNAPSVMVGADPGPVTGTVTITFASNYQLVEGTSTLTGTLTLPAGATVTSSVLTFDGVTTGPSQYLSDMSFELTGAATFPQTYFPGAGATDAGPFDYNPTTSSLGGTISLNMENGWFQNGTFETITLTVDYSLPVPSISWFDAASGGTNIGTGSPIEGVGTSVLPNTATAGPYIFYAAATVGGCSSLIPVTVNITPVNAELTPVDVTCNGGNNGSFVPGTAGCGTAPFEYSLDNGATFGPIPTDLAAGTYHVIIRDASMQTGAPITVVVAEPSAPTALTASANYFSTEVAWTAEGDESQWTIEYGPAGFTPGAGTTVTATSNPWTITGLSPDTDYEFYVTANCSGPGDWAGPEPFTTNAGFSAHDNACGPGFFDISGTGTALNLADDDEADITASFPISFMGVSSDQVTVSNNGWIVVGGTLGFDVYSQDFDDSEGNIYYETVTIGGSDYFIVQWDDYAHYEGVPGQTATFEIMISQATGEVFYLYDDAIFGGDQDWADNGGDAFIAATGPDDQFVISEYETTYLSDNSCVRFYNDLCPMATNLTQLVFPTDAILDWDAGLYGETNWTLIYGPEGFDPAAVPSQAIDTFQLTSSDASFGEMLTQLTTYDVYIYSECQADNLTSGGLFTQFTTLPYCSNPSNITVGSGEDSLEVAWDWTESDPAYGVTSFNIQYGTTGFTPYGDYDSIAVANGLNNADTITDAGLLAGGVYEVYVQAVCSATNDTSSFIGPITVVMPLTNDGACGAENLTVDGTAYTFNNDGATVDADESSIAPPADGAQVATGWTNSNLNNTTWFTFTAPASGSVRINNTGIEYNGQAAVYESSDCGDYFSFLLLGANDNAIGGTSVAPNFTICGLTPGATYYLMNDGFNSATGDYSISISPIVLEAGTANPVTDICTGENVELFNTVTGADTGGVWSSSFPAVNASINGSDFESGGLAYQVFDLQYRVTDGCAYDSVVAQVHVFAPSNAGTDGTITACPQESISLLDGLLGTADLGGMWYDPANMPLPGPDVMTSNIPGQFNYDYIANNGVCPNDTANVVVTVQACAGLGEELFSGVSLFPNPSEGLVFITSDVTEAFDYTITDAKGSVVAQANGAIKSGQQNQVDLSKAETGVYFIKLSNTQAQKVFRVVIR